MNWPAVLSLSIWSAIVTGLVSLYLNAYIPSRIRRLQAKLDFVDAQLNQLYGPLAGDCVRTDRIFIRTVHGASLLYGKSMHQILSCLFDPPDEHVPLRQILLNIFSPANKEKARLIKKNTHLFGPNPPLSFYLFLVHAADVEALISLSPYGVTKTGKGKAESAKPAFADPIQADWGTRSPEERVTLLRVAPFPVALTAEVLAKTVLLQNLQREFRFRIARAGLSAFGEEDGVNSEDYWIFNRTKYYIEIKEEFRTQLEKSGALHSSDAQTLPLLWGPYLALELIEMRSWFIGQSASIKSLVESGHSSLSNQLEVFSAFLNAHLVRETFGSDPLGHSYHYDFRAFQGFDSTDPLGAKRRIQWRPGKQESADRKFRYCPRRLDRYPEGAPKLHTLSILPENADFVYHPERYRMLHGA